jgi:tetratricopeptide (TPR) repeat protein
MTPIIGRILGEAYALDGRHEAATAQVERSVETLTTMRYIPALPSAWAGLGEVHLIAGRLAEALAAAESAAAICEQHGQHATHAAVLRLLGDVHAASGPSHWDGGAAAYHRAVVMTDRLGLRPLAARCHLGLGRLWAQRGDPEGAARELLVATDIAQAIGLESLAATARSVRRSLG